MARTVRRAVDPVGAAPDVVSEVVSEAPVDPRDLDFEAYIAALHEYRERGGPRPVPRMITRVSAR